MVIEATSALAVSVAPLQQGPASPATTLYIAAGFFGIAALYFGYLTYVRGGRDARGNIWAYGLSATVVLAGYALYLTFERVGAIPTVPLVHASSVALTAVFLMLMFKESAEFFG